MNSISAKILLVASSLWTFTDRAMADTCSSLGDYIAAGFFELGPENEPLTYMLNLFPDHSVNVLALYSRALHEGVYTTSVPTVLIIGTQEYVADNENGYSSTADEVALNPILNFDDDISVELTRAEAHCFVGRLPEGVDLINLDGSRPTLELRGGGQLVFEGVTIR